MSLEKLRLEMDEIDRHLTALLCQRMACARKIAVYKSEKGLPVRQEAREREVLAGVRNAAGMYADDVSAVFDTVLRVSRDCQQKYLEKNV